MNEQVEKSAPYVSLKGAAERMFHDTSRAAQQRVKRLCETKEIPAVKDGRRWWLKVDEALR